MNQHTRTLPLALLATLIILLAAACNVGVEQEFTEPSAQENSVDLPIIAAGDESESTAASGLNTYVIIPAESRASYLVDEEFLEDALSKLGIEAGRQDVVGSTQSVEGQLQFDPETFTLGENVFSVDMTSLESDQERRDNWIRENGPNFSQFPAATFTATNLSGLPDSYEEGTEVQFQVEGELTVRGVTLPVTFDAQAKLDEDVISGVLVTRRLMSDFGIDPPSFARTLTVADEFGIQVEFTAVKQ
jgi:polyisoprenoid-binding protein YceI